MNSSNRQSNFNLYPNHLESSQGGWAINNDSGSTPDNVIKQEKVPVNQITGQHDPVTEDLFLNHPSSTSSSTSTSSNHPLPSLLLNSRSRSRSPTNNPHQPLQISSNTQLQDGIPISPPSTPPSSPTPSIAALPSSPSSSLIQTNSNNNNFNPNVNVMVRSSGGRMVDHNSGPASESDSSNAESQSETSAEGSSGGIIDNGYGNQEGWETYQEVGFKGKGKAKGKEQCAVDLLSATVSKMATSPPPSNKQSTKSTSSHQQAQSHEKVSAVEAEEKLQDEDAENEEGEEDSFTEDEELDSTNQLAHHQLLSFSRPITMPDTPAATPESFQYPSTSRGSSATSTNSSLPSGPELGVSHRPTFSARAFMVELFPSLEDKLLSAKSVVNSKSKRRKNRSLKEGWLAEDAGVELIENCFGWRGAVLDRNGAVMRKTGRGTPEKRVLYVSMPLGDNNNNNRISGGQEPNPTSTSSNHLYQSQASLRTTVLSLLDFASDSLHPPCGALVLSIEKDLLAQGELPSLLHGLCYVGGNVVSFNGEKEESAEEGGAGEKPREGVVLVRIEL